MHYNNLLLGISFSLGLPFFLLYNRSVKWLSSKLRIAILTPITITVIVGFIYAESNDARLVFYSMLIPCISFTFDMIFKRRSIKLHHRDFYLYLSQSSDIKNEGGLHLNPHILKSDIVFSAAMLIIIVGFNFLGATLFGKTNLFEEFCK